MNGKILINLETPTTQRPDAVAALATYLNRTIEGGVLDLGNIKLVKSNKGDAFYAVTAKACSCPSAAYRPGQTCKHQRKYFPQPKREVAMEEPTEGIRRLARPPEDSIKPAGKWAGGFNGPVDHLPSEERARGVA
jgi:hypothetical protein